MLCEVKKKKRGKTISFILIARWEDRERGGELKQTIKIGETTSFDFSGFPNRENSNCFNFSLRQIRNLVCCFLCCHWFFLFLILIFFSGRARLAKKKSNKRVILISRSSLPKSYFAPLCIYSPKESVWRQYFPFACRVIKDSSRKNSKVEEYRIAKYKYFLLCCRSTFSNKVCAQVKVKEWPNGRYQSGGNIIWDIRVLM